VALKDLLKPEEEEEKKEETTGLKALLAEPAPPPAGIGQTPIQFAIDPTTGEPILPTVDISAVMEAPSEEEIRVRSEEFLKGVKQAAEPTIPKRRELLQKQLDDWLTGGKVSGIPSWQYYVDNFLAHPVADNPFSNYALQEMLKGLPLTKDALSRKVQQITPYIQDMLDRPIEGFFTARPEYDVSQALNSLVTLHLNKLKEEPYYTKELKAKDIPRRFAKGAVDIIHGTSAMMGLGLTGLADTAKIIAGKDLDETVLLKDLLYKAMETNDPMLMNWTISNLITPAVKEMGRTFGYDKGEFSFGTAWDKMKRDPLGSALDIGIAYSVAGKAVRGVGMTSKQISRLGKAAKITPQYIDDLVRSGASVDDIARIANTGADDLARIASEATEAMIEAGKTVAIGEKKIALEAALRGNLTKADKAYAAIGKLGDALTSTKRDPLVFGNLVVPREYSVNPITKGFQAWGDNFMSSNPKRQLMIENFSIGQYYDDFIRNEWMPGYYKTRAGKIRARKELLKNLDPEGKAAFSAVAEGLADPWPGPRLKPKIGPSKKVQKKFAKAVEQAEELRYSVRGAWRDIADEQGRILRDLGYLAPEQVANAKWTPFARLMGYLDDRGKPKAGFTWEWIKAQGREVYGIDPVYYPQLFDDELARTVKMSDFFIRKPLQETTAPWMKTRTGKVRNYIKDPEVALIHNAAQVNRVYYTNELVKHVRQFYAKPLTEKSGLLPGYRPWYPEGHLRFYQQKIIEAKGKFRQTDLINFEDVGELTSALDKMFPGEDWASMVKLPTGIGVTKKVKMYQVPSSVAEKLYRHVTPQNTFLKVLSSLTDPWRDLTLAGTARWQVNNLFGNATLAALEGVGPQHYYILGSKKYKWWRDSIPDNVKMGGFFREQKQRVHLGKAGMYSQIQKRVSDAPGVKQFKGEWVRVADTLYGLNSKADDYFRSAVYTKYCDDLVRRDYLGETSRLIKDVRLRGLKPRVGLLPQDEIYMIAKLSSKIKNQAAKMTNTFMYSGNAMPGWARRYIRPGYPFLGWSWFMAKYGLQLPFRRPYKVKAISEIARAAYDLTGQAQLPDYLKGSIKVGHDENGKDLYFSARWMNPLETIAEVGAFVGAGETMGGLNPIIAHEFERRYGVRGFTKEPPRFKYFKGKRITYLKGKAHVWDDEAGKPVRVYPHFPRARAYLESIPHWQLVKKFKMPYSHYDDSLPWNPYPIYDREGKKKLRSKLFPALAIMGIKFYERDAEKSEEWDKRIKDDFINKTAQTLMKEWKPKVAIMGMLRAGIIQRWMEDEIKIKIGEIQEMQMGEDEAKYLNTAKQIESKQDQIMKLYLKLEYFKQFITEPRLMD
jgi:hypothetical protein